MNVRVQKTGRKGVVLYSSHGTAIAIMTSVQLQLHAPDLFKHRSDIDQATSLTPKPQYLIKISTFFIFLQQIDSKYCLFKCIWLSYCILFN